MSDNYAIMNIAAIYEEFSDMVYRIALSYVKDCSVAQDLMQEAFVRLVRLGVNEGKSTFGFESIEHQKAWLIRVTVNLCKDYFKSSWFKNHMDLEECEASISDGYQSVYERELYEKIFSLPGNHGVLLYLHYAQGYTILEVAKLTGMRRSTVATRLKKAKEELKLVLSKDDESQIEMDKEVNEKPHHKGGEYDERR